MVVQLCKYVRIKGSSRMGFVCVFIANVWGYKIERVSSIYSSAEFYVHVSVHRNKFLFNKTNRRNKFPNLFWLKNEPLHVSDSSSAHHQEFVNCTLGTGICHMV